MLVDTVDTEAAKTEKLERVLLVHGTGAADELDEGSRWWQLGRL